MRGYLLLAFVWIAAFVPVTAQANEPLWSELSNGGHVVLMRHAITTPGAGDPPGMRLDDCSTQRNLTDDGRQHARKIGDAFRARRINVDRVMSSPWCRCIETARLAFGKAEAWQALSNLFGRAENEPKQVAELRAFVAQKRTANVVLVTHGSTIAALTGISPGTGEMVVVAPQGGGLFKPIGRLRVDQQPLIPAWLFDHNILVTIAYEFAFALSSAADKQSPFATRCYVSTDNGGNSILGVDKASMFDAD